MMAKGASTEARMGSLHSKLTELFIKIVSKYEADVDAINMDDEALADELVASAVLEGLLPSPAMLGAIAKFLKDNSISIESEQVDELSAMEQRLALKKRNRPNLATVTNLPLINNG
jgi:hypothetical protein